MQGIEKIYELMEVRKSGEWISKAFARFKLKGSTDYEGNQLVISYSTWIELKRPAYIMVDITLVEVSDAEE